MATPTGILFNDPQAKPLSTTGQFQAGAYLIFYLTGTTTPANVYADGLLATPLSQVPGTAQPSCTADGAGRFNPIYLNPATTYRVQLYNAAGVKLEDTDPYVLPTPITAASIAAALAVSGSAGATNPLPYNALNSYEVAAGVTASNIANWAYQPGDIRRYGCVAGAVISTATGSVNDSILNGVVSAVAAQGQTIYIPAGNWGFQNWVIPTAARIQGAGMHNTNMVSISGATGIAVTDNGNAGKIELTDIAFYCGGNTLDPGSPNVTTYSAGIKFGYPTGTNVFGTECWLHNVWIRALPTGAPGFALNCNVAELGRIIAQTTGGIHIIGSGTSALSMESYASQGFNPNSFGITSPATNVATFFQDMWCGALEIEAMATALVPLVLNGQVSIGSLWIAMAPGTSYDHLVQIGGTYNQTWSIQNVVYYQGSPYNAVVTGGNFYRESDGSYFGGNATPAQAWSGSPTYVVGNYVTVSGTPYRCIATNTNQTPPNATYWTPVQSQYGPNFGIRNFNSENFGMLPQSFTIRLTNTAGVLQHRICEPSGAATANPMAALIYNTNVSNQNTATGTDSSTAFSYGLKIGSTSTNALILDTPNQNVAYTDLVATVVLNSTTTNVTAIVEMLSINVNGVTRIRPVIVFYTNPAGAAFALTTANIGAGTYLEVTVRGRLSVGTSGL
jgi:hypothetical protein